MQRRLTEPKARPADVAETMWVVMRQDRSRVIVAANGGVRVATGNERSLFLQVLDKLDSGEVSSVSNLLRERGLLDGDCEIVPIRVNGRVLGFAVRPAPGALGEQEEGRAVEPIAVAQESSYQNSFDRNDLAWLFWFQLVLQSLRSKEELGRFACKALIRKLRAEEVHLHIAVEGDEDGTYFHAWGLSSFRFGRGKPCRDRMFEARATWAQQLACEALPKRPRSGNWLIAPLHGKLNGVIAIRVKRRRRVLGTLLEAVGLAFGAAWRNAADSVEGQEVPLQIFAAATDQNPDPVTLQHGDFTVFYINAAACELLGLSPEQAKGRKCYELFHGTQQPPDFCPALKALRAGKPTWEEKFYEPHVGRWLWLRASWQPDAHGNPSVIVHMLRDVTELERARRVVELQASRSQLLLDMWEATGWSSSPSEGLRLALRLLADRRGFPACALFDDRQTLVAHAESEDARDLCFHEHFALPAERPSQDGFILPAREVCSGTIDREGWVIVVPVEPRPGKRWHLLVYWPSEEPSDEALEDLRELCRHFGKLVSAMYTESRLRRSESLYRAFFDNSLSIVALLDTSGRILKLNQAFASVTGLDPHDWIGREFYDLFPPEARASLMRSFQKVCQGGKERGEVALPVNGRTHWLKLEATQLDLTDSEPMVMVVATEITALKRLEQKLRQQASELEKQVEQRTQELQRINQQLLRYSQRLEEMVEERARLYRQEAARLRAVLDSAGAAVLLVRSNGVIEQASKLSAELLGMEPGELIGKDVGSIECLQGVWARMREGQGGQTAHSLVQRGLRWLDVRWSPWNDVVTSEQGYVITMIDVTHLRKLERDLEKTANELRKTVEELNENRAYLESVVQTAPVGIFALDSKGLVVEWNEEASRLTGLSREEVIGKKCPFVRSSKAGVICPVHQKRLMGRTTRQLTIRWPTNGGRPRHLAINCTRASEETGAIGCITDVTISTERRFQDNLLLGIGHRQLTMENLRSEARNLARALLRRTYARAICVYSWDQYTGVPELLAQAGLGRTLATRLRKANQGPGGWAPILEKLEQRRFYRVSGEDAPNVWKQLIGPQGSYIIVPLVEEKPFGFLFVVESENEALPEWQVDFLEAVGREVSLALTRNVMMDGLARQTERLQLLYEAGQAFLSSLDLNTMLAAVARTFEKHMPHFLCSIHLLEESGEAHVVKAASGPNAPKYVGRVLSIEEGIVSAAIRSGSKIYVPDVRSDPRYVMWHPTSRSELVLPLHGQGGIIGALNVESPDLDGFSEEDLQTFSTLAVQLASAIGNIRLFDEVVRTSEDLALQTAKALEASRLKSQFLSNVSHELRTPLNAVLGYARHVLQSESQLSEEGRQSLQKVISSGEHLLQLINDLLDLSKIEAGRLEIEKRPVDLRRLVLSCLSTIEPSARAKGLELKLDFPETLPELYTDPLRLKQVLLNLLSNAVKFTETGWVALRVRPERERILIDVVDTGIGIDEAHHEVIFESFRQIDGSATRRAGGTGLGLTISRKLARLMGGDITLSSQPGHGSTFTVNLPLNGAVSPATIEPVTGHSTADGSGSKTFPTSDRRLEGEKEQSVRPKDGRGNARG